MRGIGPGILWIGLLILSAGCSGGPPQGGDGTLSVAVGIPPLAEFVEAMAGNDVQVTIILPPGADPHAYEPTPSQVVEISRADLVLAVGSHLPFEDRLLQGLTGREPAPPVVNLSEGIEFIDRDPHTWLSPTNARQMVEHTTDALCAQKPDRCSSYRTNRDAYLARLEATDARIRERLAHARVNTFLVVHPAWTYFARDYGLTEIAIQEEGKEPTASDLARLIQVAREAGVQVVFVEPQYSSREAEILASQIQGRVEVIDPLARNYLENLEQVAERLEEA